jgi:hypothetical protein
MGGTYYELKDAMQNLMAYYQKYPECPEDCIKSKILK